MMGQTIPHFRIPDTPSQFPGLTNVSVELSPDGKEMVFVTPRLRSRLILLENIFK